MHPSDQQYLDTFDNEEGEEYEASSFGGFGDYMRRKRIKLQNADAEIRASSVDNPPIFRGVIATVNGYTQPSSQDLHHLIVSHGGAFLQHLDGKSLVTHIIASSLTPKKREEFRRYRIVKPAWVVDSIQAGRLLPWNEYRVIDEGPSQKILKFENGFISNQVNRPRTGYKELTGPNRHAYQENDQTKDHTSLATQRFGAQNKDSTVNHDISSSEGPMSDYGDFPSLTTQEGAGRNIDHRDEQDEPEPIMDNEEAGHETPSRFPDPEINVAQNSLSLAREPVPPKPTTTPEEYNAQLLADSRMRNSSVVNPDFLQQFYKESRLHHLSTWRADLKAQLQSAANEKSQSQIGRRLVPGARRYILHVDFDCFFAAVSIRKHPEVKGKPVAVAHGPGAGSEIASCSYEARARGVKNGMWMKGALQECPDLQVLPYDFLAYEDASRKFYSSILGLDGVVQSVSIDEALVDISALCLEAGGSDGRGISEGSIYREQAKADEIAQGLRASVKDKTDCTVSVGIGGNILLAKVALKKAKPAGQYQLKPDAVLDFIGNLTVESLPGVGFSLSAKLEELGAKYVKDVRDLSREKLLSNLGPKTGTKMWEYARGIDRTEVGSGALRKSVSAEVNWGIRFVTQIQAEDFVKSLCEELHRRLVENTVKGKQLTLKVMRRSSDAPLEPVKHLGHGKCDVFNKSVILGVATNAKGALGKEAVSMLRSLHVSPGDLRGLGVQMTKLEPLKSGAPEKPESSQRLLDFQKSPIRSVKRKRDPDDVDSPSKGNTYNLDVSESARLAPSLNDSNQKPLNISGSQFIMPSQPDPQAVSELPGDIRSKLVSQGNNKRRSDSRSECPCPPPSRSRTPAPAAAEPPPQSQLDPEALSALPDDVRAEVLAYYGQPSARSDASRPSTPSTAPSRPSSSGFPTKTTKKPPIPTKNRRSRLSKPAGNTTLTLSSFVLPQPGSTDGESTSSSTNQPSGISEEFLAALPDDIRREVLEEEQRKLRIARNTGVIIATRKSNNTKETNPKPPPPSKPPPPQKRIRLPPLPERPTFTSRGLSSLPELRDAVGAWYSAFADEGPFREDVSALGAYLRRVVVEEKDIDKAVSVVRWLMWVVGDGRGRLGERGSGAVDTTGDGSDVWTSQGCMMWEEALGSLQDNVRDAVVERGLSPIVDFN